MSGKHRVLNMPENAWIIPSYVGLFLNVPKFVWMAFVLHSPIDCFLGRKNLIFSIVTGSIWFCFLFLDWIFCASKVLDLVLPLGAKGARGFESYTTSEIPNKYIYDAFLMIYLSILLLLLFSLFGTSKELIRDSQRL